ncbi:hypothetical protein GH714_017223 [Hevea brasiliensis]|uniref:Cationic amino acid transporter C-terminal domain-containing protein n=1 Tax=Hevea brasiliensis TaxID=3981 RepID=A0A6A6ME83_HEVBR|nr:hypothetical protein GH714_017223 [Hevea brasiliensis]
MYVQKRRFLARRVIPELEKLCSALSNIKTRLKDRFLARSMDSFELQELRGCSGHEMKTTLNWWDMIWFGVGTVLGAGIFVLTGEAARNDAGPAVVVSYFISGISAMLSVLCYSEFAVELPVAGGSFSYLRVELGDFVAYIAAGIFCSSTLFLVLSTKGSSRFNSIAAVIHIVVLVFIFIMGLTKANPANFANFAPFGIRGILKGSAMLFFAYVGFDGVATLATLILMQPYTQIDVNAPFTLAFQAAGMNWAKYIVAFGALKGMTTVLLGNIIGQARYFTHIGRTHMAPPILSAINEKTGTPVNATVIMTVANSIVAFFTSLDILSNLLSIATLFIFSLVALALLVRRYYVTGETLDSDRKKLTALLVLIVGSSIGLAVYWAVAKDGWIGYAVTVPIWFLSTLGLQLTLKQARKPKLWGMPLVPWLPSASIAMNMFIMGSIDRESFIRFAAWTAILLVYYLFVALHASYDAAKEMQRKANATNNLEAEIITQENF